MLNLVNPDFITKDGLTQVNGNNERVRRLHLSVPSGTARRMTEFFQSNTIMTSKIFPLRRDQYNI
jgi:hypothetical protein